MMRTRNIEFENQDSFNSISSEPELFCQKKSEPELANEAAGDLCC